MLGRFAKELLQVSVTTIVAALFVQTWLFRAYVVPSDSMEPTLRVGDHVLVNRFIHHPVGPVPFHRDVGAGDVVVFRLPGEHSKVLVKRCVAVAGDTVSIRDKDLIVNGTPSPSLHAVFRDPHTYPKSQFLEPRLRDRDNFGPLTVPSGSIFVLGDNRDISFDSRFWGTVPLASVVGSARLIYWSQPRAGRGEPRAEVRWSRIGQSVK